MADVIAKTESTTAPVSVHSWQHLVPRSVQSSVTHRFTAARNRSSNAIDHILINSTYKLSASLIPSDVVRFVGP